MDVMLTGEHINAEVFEYADFVYTITAEKEEE